jgi:hypothetical protein
MASSATADGEFSHVVRFYGASGHSMGRATLSYCRRIGLPCQVQFKTFRPRRHVCDIAVWGTEARLDAYIEWMDNRFPNTRLSSCVWPMPSDEPPPRSIGSVGLSET